MTTTEARAVLIAHDPEVTYCVTEQQWYNINPKVCRTTYDIFMHVEGKAAQQVLGSDLETVVAEAKQFIITMRLPLPPLFSHASH